MTVKQMQAWLTDKPQNGIIYRRYGKQSYDSVRLEEARLSVRVNAQTRKGGRKTSPSRALF